MEPKSAIASVLMLSLVLTLVQVDAMNCCPTTTARNIFNVCRIAGGSRATCASLSGCKINQSSCDSPYIHETLDNSGGRTVNAYCKLGCVSSVCGPITALQISGEAGMKEAVEKCREACFEFCTKEESIGARAIE